MSLKVLNRPDSRPRRAARPEHAIQDTVLRYLALERRVAWAHRFNTGAQVVDSPGKRRRFIRYAFPGCADILGQLTDGRLLAVEVKAPGKHPTPAVPAAAPAWPARWPTPAPHSMPTSPRPRILRTRPLEHTESSPCAPSPNAPSAPTAAAPSPPRTCAPWRCAGSPAGSRSSSPPTRARSCSPSRWRPPTRDPGADPRPRPHLAGGGPALHRGAAGGAAPVSKHPRAGSTLEEDHDLG